MKNFQSQDEILLSRKRASEFLGICVACLDKCNISRIKIRRRVLYRRSVLEQWLNDHTQVQEGSHE